LIPSLQLIEILMSTSDKVVRFSQEEGVDLDVILTSKFFQKEGGELVEIVASVAQGFKVHKRDSHAHNLITLFGLLLLLPQA
jgi:hypothetical protein